MVRPKYERKQTRRGPLWRKANPACTLCGPPGVNHGALFCLRLFRRLGGMICMNDLRRGHFRDAHEFCRRMYKRGTFRLPTTCTEMIGSGNIFMAI